MFGLFGLSSSQTTCNSIGDGTFVLGGCYILNATLSIVYECSSDEIVTVSGYKNTDCSGSAFASVDYNSSVATFTCDETDCDFILINTYLSDECSGVPASQSYLYVDQCLSFGSGSIEYTCSGDSYSSTVYTSDDCTGTSADLTVNTTDTSGICIEYDCSGSGGSSDANKNIISSSLLLFGALLFGFIILV